MILNVFAASLGYICFLYILQDGVVAAPAKAKLREGSVYCQNRECQFVPDILDWEKAQAVGAFNDTLLTTGWGILDISAGQAKREDQTADDIMFAAGYLEGVLTASQMEHQYQNLFRFYFAKQPDGKLVKALNKWFIDQRSWADIMIQNSQDPFWRHASYIFAQLDGLYAGYKAAGNCNKATLDMFAINYLNANGDLIELMPKLFTEITRAQEKKTKMTLQETKNNFFRNGRCSALIKVLPGYENIYMAHSSWYTYIATNRIFKHYNLNVSDPYTATRKLSFSSYPGMLESLDDFYILDSGLMMLQTTNPLLNTTLYGYMSPQSLFAWQRVRIASMMAHNGKEWTDIFSKYNSGTYNCQYMVLDLKLIELQRPLPDNTLWVAEQIPGLVFAKDLTPILRQGYFSSYNVPFFEEVFNKSNLTGLVTYELSPRAKIFRRDQASVKDLATMKALLRSNDYKNDQYSSGNPENAICSRPDLHENGTSTIGCYDTKVTDFKMAKLFQAEIINGPTLGTNLPPFSWSGQFANESHAGLPQVYNFSFIQTQPRF